MFIVSLYVCPFHFLVYTKYSLPEKKSLLMFWSDWHVCVHIHSVSSLTCSFHSSIIWAEIINNKLSWNKLCLLSSIPEWLLFSFLYSSGRLAVDKLLPRLPAAPPLLLPVPQSQVQQGMMEKLIAHPWLIWAYQWEGLIIFHLFQM